MTRALLLAAAAAAVAVLAVRVARARHTAHTYALISPPDQPVHLYDVNGRPVGDDPDGGV